MADQTKNHYHINISLCDTYTAEQAAKIAHLSRGDMYKLSKDEVDPFPLRYYRSKTREGLVLREELFEWIKRNTDIGKPSRG